MTWLRGNIELEDGAKFSGSFFLKEDGQLDEVFRPDTDDNYYDDEENEELNVNPVSPYQHPSG